MSFKALSIIAIAAAAYTGVAKADMASQAMNFKTNVTALNASDSQKAKIVAAAGHIKRVVGSKEFKDAVLNFTYNGAKTFYYYSGSTKYSNDQVYQMILDGSEYDWNPGDNNTLDLKVSLYYNGWTSTVGYYSGGSTIYQNTKFFNGYDSTGVAHNMFHEWTHMLGFSHTSGYTSARDSSVPYALGYIMEKLAKRTDLTPISGGTEDPTDPVDVFAGASNVKIVKSGSNIVLSWAAGKGDISGYKVFRRLGTATTNTLQTKTSALSFSQSAPTSKAVYYVRTVNTNGETIKSDEVTYSPVFSGVTDLALATDGAKVNLTWGKADSPNGIKGYKIFRRLSSSSTSYLQDTVTVLNFSQTAPSQDAVYYVRAVDGSGATIKSVEVSFDRP